MTHHTDAERAEFEKLWAERPIYMGQDHQKEIALHWWQAAHRAPAAPVPLRKPTVAQVTDAIGYHASAWDCVDPRELIDAILMLAAAPQPPANET